ncbi:hypothetical protein ABZ714_11345 [Streptomyces sp. NPDC006798]|uniref:hypothetical protein n=1 Tax=Streptomyces sp. NPDC006798 TaxID=3155462 RepID=UPI0033D5C98B
MHEHEHDHDVEGFATVLAGELPGRWSVEYREHANRAEQMARAEAVWDMGPVADAVARYPLRHDAILTAGDGVRLYVTGHPSRDGFLVAAIAPPLIAEAFRGVREPDGIAVPADPFSAADAVSTGLLPRYQAAFAQVQDAAARLESRPPVVLTWAGPDLHATADSESVMEILTECGFTPSLPGRTTLVLGGADTAQQARAVRAAGARLAQFGIHLALRHPAVRPGPGTTVSPAQQPRPTARAR